MGNQEKIEEIKTLVKEYNERHALREDSKTDNKPGRAVLDIFNSTEFVEKYNAETHEDTTCEDWEFEPDKTYYDLEINDFIESTDIDLSKVEDIAIRNYHGPWFYEQNREQVLSKSFTYFYTKAKKLLTE